MMIYAQNTAIHWLLLTASVALIVAAGYVLSLLRRPHLRPKASA